MDATPFRKLGDQNTLTGVQAYYRTIAELKQLPWNWQLTQDLCDPSRFSGIIIIDGKYVAVKDFERKIPCIWALDYLSHDPIHGDLFLVEDEMAFSQFFQKLYDLGYTLRLVVADDREGLKQALLKVFPYARLQLCHNHYLENIRRQLNLRTDNSYEHFFNSLKLHVFTQGVDEQTVEAGWRHVWKEHTHGNLMLQGILKDIARRKTDLFNYLKVPNAPSTTNLIESYNSHLQGRLETIKGFQSFDSASRWFNAYLIRRRTLNFTDCEGKFKYLNKHCSLEFTIKKQAQWPEVLKKLGIKAIKFCEKSG